jgi:methionyl-tRNA formyltransferase
LFRPDEGIDAGPIYVSHELEIGPNESAGSYYYGTVFDAGVAATLEAVELVLAGSSTGEVQDESQATYDPLCRDEHAEIDWSRTAGELHNLIRGCDPSPGAHTTSKGRRVRLYGSRRGETTDAEPGSILAIGDDGVEIATADAAVIVAKMDVGAGKTTSAEAAAEAGLRVGDRLGG